MNRTYVWRTSVDSTVNNCADEAVGLRNSQYWSILQKTVSKKWCICQELVAKMLPLLLLQGYFWPKKQTNKQKKTKKTNPKQTTETKTPSFKKWLQGAQSPPLSWIFTNICISLQRLSTPKASDSQMGYICWLCLQGQLCSTYTTVTSINLQVKFLL